MWRQLPGTPGPPVRADAAVAFDAEQNATVVFGGFFTGGSCPVFTDCPLGDTWEFSGGVWQNLTPAHPTASNTPTARWGAALSYEPSLGALILFGGTTAAPTGINNPGLNDTWEFVGGTWSRVCSTGCGVPTDRWDASLTYSSKAGSLLLFGGETTVSGTAQSLNDTWTFGRVPGWVAVPTPTAPSPRSSASFAFDAQLGGAVLFGGNPANAETWWFANSTWQVLTLSVGSATPSARGGAGMALDPLNGSVTLFGGCPAIPCAGTGDSDTWVLAGATWYNLTGRIGPAPAGRGESALVASGPRGSLTLFGGWSGAPTNDTWSIAHIETSSVAASPSALDVGNTTTLTVNVQGGFGPERLVWSGLPIGCASSNASLLLCADNSTGPDSAAVFVTATDPVGEVVRSATTIVQFNARPSVTVVATPLKGIGPLQVSFLAEPSGGTGALTTSWSFGDGLQANGPNPTHTFSDAGTFVVTVWANDSEASGTAQVTVTVVGRLVANVTFSSASVVVGRSTTLQVRVAGGVAPYSVGPLGTLPNCSSTGAGGGSAWNFSCTPNASGAYRVTFHVTDGSGQSRNVSANLTVTDAAAAPAGAGSGRLTATEEVLIALVLALAIALVVGLALYRRGRRPKVVPPPHPERPLATANLYVPPDEPRR